MAKWQKTFDANYHTKYEKVESQLNYKKKRKNQPSKDVWLLHFVVASFWSMYKWFK